MITAELWLHQFGKESICYNLYGQIYRIGRDSDGEIVVNRNNA